MACPECGSKVTYAYGDSDIYEKCSACGKVFDNELEGLDEQESVQEEFEYCPISIVSRPMLRKGKSPYKCDGTFKRGRRR